MKELSLPARMHMLANNILDILTQPQETTQKALLEKEKVEVRHDRSARKNFFFYQPMFDDKTQELVGHLSDISSSGFKLDSQQAIPIDVDFRFFIRLTSDVSDKPSMVFKARSRWCKVDPLDPFIFNVGFQLVHISPDDLTIFNRMMEKYGSEPNHKNINFRRSNKW